jgi:NAD(P)-dependent dehydrogenase (short-subunit alcohol dehydrogenase family)
MSNGQVRVAVIGTADIGRGWAALIAAAGWPVAVYDHHGRNSGDALAEIADRARRLVELHQADSATVESGIKLITVGRSLLEACRDAQWIIEAIQEDVKAKQKLVESFEAAAPEARPRLGRCRTVLDLPPERRRGGIRAVLPAPEPDIRICVGRPCHLEPARPRATARADTQRRANL